MLPGDDEEICLIGRACGPGCEHELWGTISEADPVDRDCGVCIYFQKVRGNLKEREDLKGKERS